MTFLRTTTIGRALVVLIALLGILMLSGAAQAASVVAPRFADYYNRHQGMRVLGPPVSGETSFRGYASQYFEKGRIEDHAGESADPRWRFMYGRLTAELISLNPSGSVSGTGLSYRDLRAANEREWRREQPAGYSGGVMAVPGGVFVPYDPQLRGGPGYLIDERFWAYINRAELFPGGWLHDVGLPMTDAFLIETYKGGERRNVMIQAFERAVLTYDPQNPAAWQVERANLGLDYAAAGMIDPTRPQVSVTVPRGPGGSYAVSVIGFAPNAFIQWALGDADQPGPENLIVGSATVNADGSLSFSIERGSNPRLQGRYHQLTLIDARAGASWSFSFDSFAYGTFEAP